MYNCSGGLSRHKISGRRIKPTLRDDPVAICAKRWQFMIREGGNMKSFVTIALTFVILISACYTAADKQVGKQRPAQLDTEVRVQLRYLLYLPKDNKPEKPTPLLLFLHGAGESGDDLELVTLHGPPKLIAAGKDFPFIVVSPQCPKDQMWEPIELVALLDEIERLYKVDQNRVYVTGLSMGGFGTWRLAAFAPHRFAAIAPICGGGENHWVGKMRDIPVWAFHGAKDVGVPVERSQSMIDALKDAGANPKLTIYPDAEHDSWTQTYDNPELYQWLLQQKRSSL